MRQLTAILRRETGAFFHSAIAPVVMAIFLLLVGVLFFNYFDMYSDQSAIAQDNVRSGNFMNLAEGIWGPLIRISILFLMLLMPAVTMRLFSPEFKSGRYTLVASWPVEDHVWILGKWLATVTIAALLIFSTAPLFGSVWLFGNPETGSLISAWLGLFLVSGCLAALGVLFSTLFSQQVIAYFVSVAVVLLLFMVGLLENSLPGVFGRFCGELSFQYHFDRFSRGVVDLRSILLFLSLTAVALFAATAALASRRQPARRRALTWMPTCVACVLAIVVYLIGLQFPWSLDLTTNKRYSLAPQTVQVLDALPTRLDALADQRQTDLTSSDEDLPDDVVIRAFYQTRDPARTVMESLLKSFVDQSDRVRYEMVDPEENLELIKEYQVTVARTVVVQVGVRATLLLQPEESALINAVYRLATDTRPMVLHLLGHGEHLLDNPERPGYSELGLVLEDQGYNLRTIYLSDVAHIPESAQVMIIAGPRTNPTSPELDALDAFVDRGGAVLAMFDPPTPPMWNQWLDKWNVRVTGNVLISSDPGRTQYGVGARTIVVSQGYSSHEITKSLEGVATLFPLVQPLRNVRPVDPESPKSVLLVSSPASWSEHDPDHKFAGKAQFTKGEDLPGPLPFGVALEIPAARETDPTARLVLIGNSEFLTNANLQMGGNRDLLLNILGWLAREETLINIRGGQPLHQPVILSPGQKKVLGWGAMLGWPLFMGSLSLGIMLHRRREEAKS